MTLYGGKPVCLEDRQALEEEIEECGREGANDVGAGSVVETGPEGVGDVFPQGKEKLVGGGVRTETEIAAAGGYSTRPDEKDR